MQNPPIAQDERVTGALDLLMAQRPNNDLSTYPGGIAHGNSDDRFARHIVDTGRTFDCPYGAESEFGNRLTLEWIQTIEKSATGFCGA